MITKERILSQPSLFYREFTGHPRLYEIYVTVDFSRQHGKRFLKNLLQRGYVCQMSVHTTWAQTLLRPNTPQEQVEIFFEVLSEFDTVKEITYTPYMRGIVIQ